MGYAAYCAFIQIMSWRFELKCYKMAWTCGHWVLCSMGCLMLHGCYALVSWLYNINIEQPLKVLVRTTSNYFCDLTQADSGNEWVGKIDSKGCSKTAPRVLSKRPYVTSWEENRLQKHKSQIGSPKSLGFIIGEQGLSVPNFVPNHLINIEMYNWKSETIYLQVALESQGITNRIHPQISSI